MCSIQTGGVPGANFPQRTIDRRRESFAPGFLGRGNRWKTRAAERRASTGRKKQATTCEEGPAVDVVCGQTGRGGRKDNRATQQRGDLGGSGVWTCGRVDSGGLCGRRQSSLLWQSPVHLRDLGKRQGANKRKNHVLSTAVAAWWACPASLLTHGRNHVPSGPLVARVVPSDARAPRATTDMSGHMCAKYKVRIITKYLGVDGTKRIQTER